MIDKIQKLAMSMKKHKSHARHVFNYLEKTYGMNLHFGDEEAKGKAKKGERKSMGTKNANQRGTQLIDEETPMKEANEFVKKGGMRPRKQTQDN